MKFTIKGQPVFDFSLRGREISLISDCARAHYDAACRAAAEPGGFVYGWARRADLSPPDALVEVSATWDQLDSVLKILENTSRLSTEDRVLGDKLTRSFHLALIAARGLMQANSWVHRLDTSREPTVLE